MKKLSPLLRTTVPLAVIASVACGRVLAQARADNGHPDYSAADVHFMSGMIYHHAQAVLIAGWAPTHDASPSLRALCERIVVGQRDEIMLMRRWLQARHEDIPDTNAAHDTMPGMDHPMMMPGMLTVEQLAQLDRARGPEFDRLFLTFMIQHHKGAITMVNQLFGQGAGELIHHRDRALVVLSRWNQLSRALPEEQETVFRFASGVYADQTTEIDRMQRM